MCHVASAQNLKANLFIRTPQIVNFKLVDSVPNYSSLISVGCGITHKAKFFELGAFTGDGNLYGFYSFFGSTLKSKNLGNNWFINTNWFGEVTHIPRQGDTTNSNIYTCGICFVLYYASDWGSIGFPLCLGAAYQSGDISINSRTIFNASINL